MFKGDQFAAGLQTEFVGEPSVQALVGGKGLGLAAGPVKGDHEMGPGPLPVGIVGDGLFGVGGHAGVLAHGQARFQPGFNTTGAQFFEVADGPLGPGSVGHFL